MNSALIWMWMDMLMSFCVPVVKMCISKELKLHYNSPRTHVSGPGHSGRCWVVWCRQLWSLIWTHEWGQEVFPGCPCWYWYPYLTWTQIHTRASKSIYVHSYILCIYKSVHSWQLALIPLSRGPFFWVHAEIYTLCNDIGLSCALRGKNRHFTE